MQNSRLSALAVDVENDNQRAANRCDRHHRLRQPNRAPREPPRQPVRHRNHDHSCLRLRLTRLTTLIRRWLVNNRPSTTTTSSQRLCQAASVHI